MKRPEGNHSVVHRDGSILPQVLRQVISAELRLCLELCDVELDTPGLHTQRHETKGAGKNAPRLFLLDRLSRLARGLRLQPPTEGLQMDSLLDLVPFEPRDKRSC